MPIVRLADGRAVDTAKLPDGYRVRYGRIFKPGVTLIQIELAAFRGGWAAPYGLGKTAHFKRIVEALWPLYEWNRWSDDQAKALCENDLVAFMGCGGSGKSLMLAMWALVNWWSAPQDCVVAITSTDIEGAKKRVWGHVIICHQGAKWTDDLGNKMEPPGKLTDQPAMVRLADTTDGLRGAGQQAISLVPAGNENLNNAIKQLQGMHNKIVILILDELQDLGNSVIGGVLENLNRNPYFQICAAGNIGDANDPLGQLCRPVTQEGLGYDDVDSETHSWKIERAGKVGVCVRFDAECTPNMDDHKPGEPDRYPFLPGVEEVRQKRKDLEDGKIELGDYYRQWKAFITPANVEDGRWSSAAILRFNGYKNVGWASPGGFVALAGVDPAYTSGGDRFIVYFGEYGLADNGLWTIHFRQWFSLQHDANDHKLRNFAMAQQTKRLCQEREYPVESQYVAIDVSGENPLGDIFAEVWDNEFLRVSFSGAASEMLVSQTDRRPCSHEYANKATEMWCIGANFLRHDQLRGIDKEQANELASRKIVRGTRNKLVAETKREMKRRTRFSPDVSDGGNLILENARQRLGAIAGAEGVIARTQAWQEEARKSQVLPVRLRSHVGIAHVSRALRRR